MQNKPGSGESSVHQTCIAPASVLAMAIFVSALAVAGASAQLAVSANDGKVVNVDGKKDAVEDGPQDSVTIIDLGKSPPQVIGEVKAGASVVGVPQSVAISPDESIAVVTAANKLDPADAKQDHRRQHCFGHRPEGIASAVIQKVEVGVGPSGVSFSPDGKLVLVANRAGGAVSVLTVAGKTLTPAGTVDLGNPKSGSSHVAFLRDGKRALVTRDGDHRVSVLSIDGTKVEDTKQFRWGGFRPYSMEISTKGDVAVFGNQGGGQGEPTSSTWSTSSRPAAHRRHDLGRADTGRREHVAGRGVRRHNGDERLAAAEGRIRPITTTAWSRCSASTAPS